jgi:hypothetical protein
MGTVHLGAVRHTDGYCGATVVAHLVRDDETSEVLAVYPHGYHRWPWRREHFERSWERVGVGQAPNGASYYLHGDWHGKPAVLRVDRGLEPGNALPTEANATRIVGTRGQRFETLEAARAWAMWDGCQSNPGAEEGQRVPMY